MTSLTTWIPRHRSHQLGLLGVGLVAAPVVAGFSTEIGVEHSIDSSAIDAVAFGQAAEKEHASARDMVASGMTYTGEFTFKKTPDIYVYEATGPDGTAYPFGTAQLIGCVDSSSISAANVRPGS
jgi:hypothetical protein